MKEKAYYNIEKFIQYIGEWKSSSQKYIDDCDT